MVEFCDMSEELGSEVDLKPNRPKVPRPILSAEDKQDGRVILGLVFCENGRPFITGGPGYGNFGGGYRSKGRNTGGMTEDEISRLPEVRPVDKMDAAFKVHDDGYSLCRRRYSGSFSRFKCNIEADRVLAESLKILPEDPNQWGRGKLTPAEIEYAERYRRFAYWFFNIQVSLYDIAIPRKQLFNMSPYLMEHS